MVVAHWLSTHGRYQRIESTPCSMYAAFLQLVISNTITFQPISVCGVLYCTFFSATKFSLLFFGLKLPHLRWFRIAVYANIFLIFGYNIAPIFHMIFI